jgi:aspartyl-tRNA(Asn)/glutamyl-tRNA(Gln) amidotransferase subunit A
MAASIPDDFFFLTISELNRKWRAGEFSAVDLTRAWSDRLEKLGPRYNALALPLRDRAMKNAKIADKERKRERFRGLLQGIPFGAKDLLAAAGEPTTWGARPFAGQVFDYDATVIKRLEDVGAILTGKLSMVELAGGGGYRFPAASLQGPGLNPWDRTRWSGGSSSGSGAAVAAGLVAFALGSETWGSIMTPSAYCGVTGLRPTYGYVSRHGAMALSWTMDKIGPMCRSAEDCGIVLQAIAGGDNEDPGTAGKSFYYTPQYMRKVSDLRIGYSPIDFDETAEQETRAGFKEALEVFRSIGVTLVESKLPALPYGAAASTIISAEGSSVFEPIIENGRVDMLADQKQIAGLKAGREIPAKDYLKAMRIRRIVQEEMRKLFADSDALLSPSAFKVAPKVSEPLDRPGTSTNRADSQDRGMRDLGAAGNLAGLPALSLPCGFVAGLPIALSLVSRPFNENLILALGVEFQKRTDWHRRRPPV